MGELMGNNTVKIKKIISYITLAIYVIFMLLTTIFMLILCIRSFFGINGNIMTKDIIWSETIDTIVLDTIVLYSIPFITCIVQFFANRIYFLIQLGIISVHWLLANSIILYIGIMEIVNH